MGLLVFLGYAFGMTPKSYFVEHVVSGGSFALAGAPLGYARRTMTSGSAKFAVAARLPGTHGRKASDNSQQIVYSFEVVNPGAVLTQCRAHWDKINYKLTVAAKHNGSAVTATGAEVVAAIEQLAAADPTMPLRAGLDPTTTGSEVLAGGIAAGDLTGQLDPVRVAGSSLDSYVTTTANGGLIYLANTKPVSLRSVEVSVPTGRTCNLALVDVNPGLYALNSIQFATVVIGSGLVNVWLPPALPDLQPGRALSVTLSDTTGSPFRLRVSAIEL